jgi:hypothetical protein
LIIVGGLGVVLVAFLAVVLIAALYEAPSCGDGVRNQGETGVDCGGSCPYLCTADERAPVVLFTQALSNGDGRTDVIALVQNSNALAGARNVPYTITLYGAGKSFIQKVNGVLDLPPGGTVPVFIAGISSGHANVIRAFLDIDSSVPRWVAMDRDPSIRPTVSNILITGTTSAPRIDAVLTNPSVIDLENVQVVAFVRNVLGDVIAASKTIVPSLPGGGQVTATFTWNTPFRDIPTTIEARPIVPLP